MMKSAIKLLRMGHRNVGVVLSLFLLLFVVTGVFLNHTEGLGLARVSTPPWIADRYYLVPETSAWETQGRYYYVLGNTLYQDDRALGQCDDGIIGVADLSEQLVIGCGEDLLVLTPEGEILELLSPGHGVPGDLVAVAAVDGTLVLKSGASVVTFDLTSLQSEPFEGEMILAATATLPSDLLLRQSVSWEQFLIDVHSGRFLGRGGVWLADFVAVFLGLLAISGVVMFLLPRSNGRD